jgi:hypothetical protein
MQLLVYSQRVETTQARAMDRCKSRSSPPHHKTVVRKSFHDFDASSLGHLNTNIQAQEQRYFTPEAF